MCHLPGLLLSRYVIVNYSWPYIVTSLYWAGPPKDIDPLQWTPTSPRCNKKFANDRNRQLEIDDFNNFLGNCETLE